MLDINGSLMTAGNGNRRKNLPASRLFMKQYIQITLCRVNDVVL